MTYKELAIRDLALKYSVSEQSIVSMLKINDILKHNGFVDDATLEKLRPYLTQKLVGMVDRELCQYEFAPGEYLDKTCAWDTRLGRSMELLHDYSKNRNKSTDKKKLKQIKAIIGIHVKKVATTWWRKVFDRAVELKKRGISL